PSSCVAHRPKAGHLSVGGASGWDRPRDRRTAAAIRAAIRRDLIGASVCGVGAFSLTAAPDERMIAGQSQQNHWLDANGAFLVGATADTIWRVPAYFPYLQPPLTDEAIGSAEAEIGYKLPTDYLNLLRKQNGGYIRYSLPENVHDTIAGIGPYFPSL